MYARSKIFRLSLALTLLCGVFSCDDRGNYYQIRGYAQGGEYSVKYKEASSGIPPERVSEVIDSILVSIDFSLSGYNGNSLLSSFNRGETITPDEHFIKAYEISYKYFERSEGALDVAAGPLFDIWGFGFTSDSLPGRERIDSVLVRCGMKRLVPDIRSAIRPDGTLSPSDLLMEGEDPGVLPRLNFNAIAQGYSCDVIAGYLYAIGVRDMLVDIGEIYCDGLNPGGKGWSVGIDRPVDGNDTPGADLDGIWRSDGGGTGLVTSGNYRKFYIRDGRKFSHTIDPRTGYPAENNLLSATVSAPTAADADALATWCMVAGLEGAKAVILGDPSLEAFLIYDEGGTMSEWSSPGFLTAE